MPVEEFYAARKPRYDGFLIPSRRRFLVDDFYEKLREKWQMPVVCQAPECAAMAVVADERTVQQRFASLADQWSNNTRHISSASDLINDRSYQQIIDLGWDAVPYLLRDLQQNKRFWFPALAAITGVRPFDRGDTNNPRRMTEAWIRWGKWKGLI
jgi:hypothetical protein